MSPQASSEEKTGEASSHGQAATAGSALLAEALDPAFESFDVVKDAPVFTPTAEEFADPLVYIAKCVWKSKCGRAIEGRGDRFGFGFGRWDEWIHN